MNEPQTQPVDAKLLGIGVLSVTACVLLVGLILVLIQPTPAQANGENDRAGDYIMATQQLSTSTDAIVVIDAAARQMIFYGFDYNDRTLQILQRVNLASMPKPRPPEDDLRPRRR